MMLRANRSSKFSMVFPSISQRAKSARANRSAPCVDQTTQAGHVRAVVKLDYVVRATILVTVRA